jgi:hypothetical protein
MQRVSSTSLPSDEIQLTTRRCWPSSPLTEHCLSHRPQGEVSIRKETGTAVGKDVVGTSEGWAVGKGVTGAIGGGVGDGVGGDVGGDVGGGIGLAAPCGLGTRQDTDRASKRQRNGHMRVLRLRTH